MKKNILMSWSTGKDSAWSLCQLMARSDEYQVTGLFCTVNKAFARTAMHAVRVELLRLQAARIGLPLEILEIPWPCSNAEYERIMGDFVETAQSRQVGYFAFGDLFLQDIRSYREKALEGTGITPLFPLWEQPTGPLARQMLAGGLQAVITCIDPKKLDAGFAGRSFDTRLLQDLPRDVDPCGENGEFHTFVHNAPVFSHPIDIKTGEVVERDGFVFADVCLHRDGEKTED